MLNNRTNSEASDELFKDAFNTELIPSSTPVVRDTTFHTAFETDAKLAMYPPLKTAGSSRTLQG